MVIESGIMIEVALVPSKANDAIRVKLSGMIRTLLSPRSVIASCLPRITSPSSGFSGA